MNTLANPHEPESVVKSTGNFISYMYISIEKGLYVTLYKAGDSTDSYFCKNNMQMCLYKFDKFIGYFSHGYMVRNIIMSSNFIYLAYVNCVLDDTVNPRQDYIELLVYKVDIQNSVIHLHYKFEVDRDLCEDPDYYNWNLCFSPDNKYLIFRAEWNHLYIINLETATRTEFFIPNDRNIYTNQVIYVLSRKPYPVTTLVAGHTEIGCQECYVVWYGYDEFIRIVDLNKKSPVMWRDKMIHTITNYQLQTKYFVPLPGNYLLYMDKYNKVTIMKLNFDKQRLEFVYDIAYPAIGYDDIRLNNNKVLFLNNKFTCTIDLIEKSCRVTKNPDPCKK